MKLKTKINLIKNFGVAFAVVLSLAIRIAVVVGVIHLIKTLF